MRKYIANENPDESAPAWPEAAVFFAALWITCAFLASPLFSIHWFRTADFTLSIAMYYHGIMIPALVLMYLSAKMIIGFNLLNRRVFAGASILSVLCAGVGSILNTHEGLSVATYIQVTGMVIADLLGISLLVYMVKCRLKSKTEMQKYRATFWLLFLSISVILAAASFGHLAGFLRDFGTHSTPGAEALLHATGMKTTDFRKGLVGSHSHLIVTAFLAALAALAVICFQYPLRSKWKRRTTILGLWTVMLSLMLATGIYFISAILGWEPPCYFTSGPSGMPIDDIVLTLGEVGFLLMLPGLSGPLAGDEARPFTSLDKSIRLAVFLNWIAGFAGAVVLGVYIEFHEAFYGAGLPPAPGALNDNVFIRAHLLYSFLLLPVTFVFLLMIECRYRKAIRFHLWPRIMVWTSILGMSLGLIGELDWVLTLRNVLFVTGGWIIVAALAAGTISVLPVTVGKHLNREKICQETD